MGTFKQEWNEHPASGLQTSQTRQSDMWMGLLLGPDPLPLLFTNFSFPFGDAFDFNEQSVLHIYGELPSNHCIPLLQVRFLGGWSRACDWSHAGAGTLVISEGDRIWNKGLYTGNQIQVRSLEWLLIQYDW